MKKYTELYTELYDAVYPADNKKFKERHLSNFVAMRGSRYNEKTGKKNVVRLMIVGRAVNGWGKGMNTDSADTYASEATTLFKASDRFKTEWNMQDCDTNPYSKYTTKEGNEKKYYLSSSPFWSATRDVWYQLSGEQKSDWYEDIVWNNIYKVAPLEGGNPSTNLIYAQADICVKLLQEEIRLLQPTHILLVIDKSWISWKSKNKVMFDFMEAFEKYKCHCHSVLKDQNKAIVQCAFSVNDCKILVTCRPETVSRGDYVEAVINAFSEFNKQ